MSIKIMQEVWEFAPVDQGTLLVLLALADSADERSRTCYPGVESLAEKSRLSDRQVQYCLKRLRELNIISVSRNASPVKTNVYRLNEIGQYEIVRDAKIAPHIKKPDTQSAAPRDEVDFVSDTQSTSPKPSVTEEEPSVNAREEDSDLFSGQEQPKQKDQTVELFERLWKEYPKKGKVGKQKALANFKKAIKGGADPEEIITGAKRYAGSKSVADGFVKHLQGWLTDERWTVEYETVQSRRRISPPIHMNVVR